MSSAAASKNGIGEAGKVKDGRKPGAIDRLPRTRSVAIGAHGSLNGALLREKLDACRGKNPV